METITRYLEKAYTRVKAVEDLYFELKSLLKGLKYEFNDELVKQGLHYFQECYKSRPVRYPGDNIYLEIFLRGIKKGLSQEETSKYSKTIIDREINFIDAHLSFGLHYCENWFD